MSKTKFSTLRTRICAPEEIAELNAERLRTMGYVSTMVKEIVCCHCGQRSFVGPTKQKTVTEQLVEAEAGRKCDPVKDAIPKPDELIAAEEKLMEREKEFEQDKNNWFRLQRKTGRVHSRHYWNRSDEILGN